MLSWRPRKSTTRIIVASSHTPPETPSVARELTIRHRQQGKLECGYHFVIERGGRLVACRPHDVFGSHTRMANHDAVAVCLAGGWQGTADHTPEQITSLLHLARNLSKAYGPLPLVGQNEVYRPPGSPRSPALDLSVLRAALPSPADDQEYPDMAKKAKTTPSPQDNPTPADPKQLTPQQHLVVSYLKAGHTLTPLIALTNLGIGSITSRIAELKTAGYPINAEPDTDFNGRRYMKYTWTRDPHGRPAEFPDAAR